MIEKKRCHGRSSHLSNAPLIFKEKHRAVQMKHGRMVVLHALM
jgi:hypothetical protein